MSDIITLAHGNGGKLTQKLVKELFVKHLANDILLQGDDAARLEMPDGRLAFTTDSFVVTPVFFKGGNIGKLAVCGTVNDLAAMGAKPLYLSCGFIIEEGLPMSELEEIVAAMGATARECGVKIVTGDTKVVQKGAADKVFINTSGIGVIRDSVEVSGANAKPGDQIIITGTLGDHGCSIFLEREKMEIGTSIQSDCAPLNSLVERILDICPAVHVLRDPTRGGVATTLNEIAVQSHVAVKLWEEQLPVKEEVRGVCEILGLDPLYMANEGKMLVVVPADAAHQVLEAIQKDPYGADACIIGEIQEEPAGRVTIKTVTGGSRVMDMLVGDPLPRIC